MQELAIVYGVWAWVTVWWLDLLFALIVGPLTLLGVLRFLVVTIAMVVISTMIFRHRYWVA